MQTRPKLRAVPRCARIKCAVRAVIFVGIDRFPKVIGAISVFSTVLLLRIVTVAGQIMIEQSGRDFIPNNSFDRRHADVNFATRMMRRVNDRFGGDFRLENRWNRLRFARQSTFDPAKLRRV